MLLCVYIASYLITNYILLLISILKYEKEDRSILSKNRGCTVVIPVTSYTPGLIRTLNSIREQNYSFLEVIVVINGNNASSVKSELLSVLENTCPGLDTRIVSINRKNKANAINKALKKAKYDWYCIIDSDCTLTKTASILSMVRHTYDGVVAVGGRICVANPDSFLGRLQKMEYTRTFMCQRSAMYVASAVTIISGAYGMFNRRIVLKAGGYTTKHVGEDMDITLRLQRYCRLKHIPCKVEYGIDASIESKAPVNLRKLFWQRDRWQRGLVGSFLGNITFKKDKNFTMRYLAQPYMFIYQILSPYVFIAGLVRSVIYVLSGHLSSTDLLKCTLFLLLYIVLESIIDILSEKRRCKVDDEEFKMTYIPYAIVMQIPMMGLQSILMIAKLIGNITYPFRKNVW